MKIGILGGSFNPPHYSHIDLCEYVRNEIGLDKIILIPTGEHPFKRKVGISKYDRLHMCRLAVEEMDGYEVSDIEILKNAPSYTVDTITEMKRDGNTDEYYFICGSDLLFQLTWWKNLHELSGLLAFACVMRDGVDNTDILVEAEKINRAFGTKIILLESYSPIGLSSTEIRNDIVSARESLNPKVYEYIIENGFYQKG